MQMMLGKQLAGMGSVSRVLVMAVLLVPSCSMMFANCSVQMKCAPYSFETQLIDLSLLHLHSVSGLHRDILLHEI